MSELLTLPNGPFGHIAKRPSNIDPPDFKVAVRRWRQLRNKSPIYLLDDWLWEREKNRIRRLWYELTPGQRQRLKDEREDTGQRILHMRPFNGLKYQRGMLSGMSVKRSATGAGPATLNLGSAGNSATNVELSPSGPLDAGFGCLSNGQHNRVDADGTLQVDTDEWISSNPSVDVGDDYEVEWNQLTGTALNDESYTEATWTTINVGTGNGRYVGQSSSAAAQIKTFEIDIGDVGTSTSDINQDYSVEAGELV